MTVSTGASKAEILVEKQESHTELFVLQMTLALLSHFSYDPRLF
jgi:hypothetical protein